MDFALSTAFERFFCENNGTFAAQDPGWNCHTVVISVARKQPAECARNEIKMGTKKWNREADGIYRHVRTNQLSSDEDRPGVSLPVVLPLCHELTTCVVKHFRRGYGLRRR